MTVRKLFFLAAAIGLVTGATALAQTKPSQATSPTAVVENQKLADSVAGKLRASGVMKGAKVNIETSGGTVILSGTATDTKQHEAILRAITGVPGIKRIESEIQTPEPTPAAATTAPIKRTGGEEPSPLAVPNVLTQGGPRGGLGAPGGFGGGALPQDPLPLNAGMAMGPMDPAGPKLPPHAWPTYAPYNNYSRVAYPGAYPYNAFPYIGPFYPFPKVPLGWRKVVLEWDDGHWFIGRLSTPKDYWRVKFW